MENVREVLGSPEMTMRGIAAPVVLVRSWFIPPVKLSTALGQFGREKTGRVNAHPGILDGIVGGMIGTLATIGLGWVAWQHLSDVSRTTSADFMLRLKRDFFSPEARTLVSLVANRWLQFIEQDAQGNQVDIPYLAVQLDAIADARLPDDVKARLSQVAIYTAFEADDLLLGPLDDVATLWEAHTLNTEQIRQVFGWYIELAWDTPEVKAYIDHQQRDESPEVYAALGRLREALKK